MIQIARSRLIVRLTPGRLKKMREHFKKNLYVKFPGILAPDLKKYARQSLRDAEFIPVIPPRVGRELQMKENAMDHTFLFAHNDPELFNILYQISDCGPIRSYTGRAYRFIPGGPQYDDWHSDTMDQRVLALSINLSEKPYEGGMLMIRDKKTRKIISKVENLEFGDAILFKIHRSLEHCLTPLSGKASKTAYAGWFSRLSNGFLDVQRSAA